LVGAERCSSTRVRAALEHGAMEEVAQLLGRRYSIMGRVGAGDRRGRELGFPTANIVPPPVFLPAYGIYAVRAHVRGVPVMGVANFGIRPDFPLPSPLLEVHLFNWGEEIYGERIVVELVRYLRQEAKFDGVEALKAQMAKDCQQAQSVLA